MWAGVTPGRGNRKPCASELRGFFDIHEMRTCLPQEICFEATVERCKSPPTQMTAPIYESVLGKKLMTESSFFFLPEESPTKEGGEAAVAGCEVRLFNGSAFQLRLPKSCMRKSRIEGFNTAVVAPWATSCHAACSASSKARSTPSLRLRRTAQAPSSVTTAPSTLPVPRLNLPPMPNPLPKALFRP